MIFSVLFSRGAAVEKKEISTVFLFQVDELEEYTDRPDALTNYVNARILDWASSLSNFYSIKNRDFGINEIYWDPKEAENVAKKNKDNYQVLKFFSAGFKWPKKELSDYLEKITEEDKEILLKYFNDKYEQKLEKEF